MKMLRTIPVPGAPLLVVTVGTDVPAKVSSDFPANVKSGFPFPSRLNAYAYRQSEVGDTLEDD